MKEEQLVGCHYKFLPGTEHGSLRTLQCLQTSTYYQVFLASLPHPGLLLLYSFVELTVSLPLGSWK